MNAIHYFGNFLHVYKYFNNDIFHITVVNWKNERITANLKQEDIEYIASKKDYTREVFHCLDDYGVDNNERFVTACLNSDLYISFYNANDYKTPYFVANFKHSQFAKLVEALI